MKPISRHWWSLFSSMKPFCLILQLRIRAVYSNIQLDTLTSNSLTRNFATVGVTIYEGHLQPILVMLCIGLVSIKKIPCLRHVSSTIVLVSRISLLISSNQRWPSAATCWAARPRRSRTCTASTNISRSMTGRKFFSAISARRSSRRSKFRQLIVSLPNTKLVLPKVRLE